MDYIVGREASEILRLNRPTENRRGGNEKRRTPTHDRATPTTHRGQETTNRYDNHPQRHRPPNGDASSTSENRTSHGTGPSLDRSLQERRGTGKGRPGGVETHSSDQNGADAHSRQGFSRARRQSIQRFQELRDCQSRGMAVRWISN